MLLNILVLLQLLLYLWSLALISFKTAHEDWLRLTLNQVSWPHVTTHSSRQDTPCLPHPMRHTTAVVHDAGFPAQPKSCQSVKLDPETSYKKNYQSNKPWTIRTQNNHVANKTCSILEPVSGIWGFTGRRWWQVLCFWFNRNLVYLLSTPAEGRTNGNVKQYLDHVSDYLNVYNDIKHHHEQLGLFLTKSNYFCVFFMSHLIRPIILGTNNNPNDKTWTLSSLPRVIIIRQLIMSSITNVMTVFT